ncbi:hypothetical protein S-CBS2_gp080 [Synechococcus phage S-CBS2]|uniref:hypothetical protein n=1 Tax=Synechococcus phage S-CBS2 TaxID=753084 RepID=UPI0002078429|nr:hypothetical protein S-CBS2_gp080 [Synechococcus phage S-CBS2]ADF42436.1 hypothetical protein S-CBS2_gp080 [Synechococcus phage S-CBS2]
MYTVVHLTEEEKLLAKAEGHRRQSVNESSGVKGRNLGPEKGAAALRMHVIGAGGEMAVASLLGLKDHLYLDKSPRRGSADLPGRIDVKTRAKHYYDLLCQKDEEDDKVLVLVTIENKEIRVHGWIESSKAKDPAYWQEFVPGRGCYAVPQSTLNPIETLK